MRLALDKIGGRLPRGWSDVFRQLGLFVLADVCYETVPELRTESTMSHSPTASRSSIRASTHTFFEPDLQAFFLPARWLIDFANQVYMNSQFAITIAFLVWLYLFRNETFYFVRNMFMASMGLALIGYTLFPTAPPRLYPQYGFVDTITDLSNVNHDSAIVKVFINPYAAVPSMHCAFAIMIGATGLARQPPLVHQGLLGRLAAARRLGRDRDRKPLLGRCGARGDGRRDLGADRARLGAGASGAVVVPGRPAEATGRSALST